MSGLFGRVRPSSRISKGSRRYMAGSCRIISIAGGIIRRRPISGNQNKSDSWSNEVRNLAGVLGGGKIDLEMG